MESLSPDGLRTERRSLQKPERALLLMPKGCPLLPDAYHITAVLLPQSTCYLPCPLCFPGKLPPYFLPPPDHPVKGANRQPVMALRLATVPWLLPTICVPTNDRSLRTRAPLPWCFWYYQTGRGSVFPEEQASWTVVHLVTSCSCLHFRLTLSKVPVSLPVV